MSSELKDTLKKRLDENYTAFIESLQGKTVSELIAMAPEITAAQQSEITGYDHSGEMGHMLWDIRDRELYLQKQRAQPAEGMGGIVQNEGLSERREDTVKDGHENGTVKQIAADNLRRMDGQEGLVLQGCGGPPQEWVDGINNLLTEAGILLDGSTFKTKAVSSFQHDGVTCLLFPFEDVKLDMGRLAMWRLQTHGQFGGTTFPTGWAALKKNRHRKSPKWNCWAVMAIFSLLWVTLPSSFSGRVWQSRTKR